MTEDQTYFMQLIHARAALRIMNAGMKIRYVSLKSIRQLFNLTSKTTKDALAEIETKIADYKSKNPNTNHEPKESTAG